MKIDFILISVALHAILLTVPISKVEETREYLIPATLVVETVTPESQASTAVRLTKTSSGKPRKKQIRRSERDQVEGHESAPPELAAQENLFIKRAEILSVEDDIVERALETALFDRAPANDLQPLPAAQAIEPPPKTKAVEEKKATLAAKRFFDHGNGTPPAPEHVLLRANYAYTPRPEYPDRARREGSEGTVLLAILVDAEGRPERIVLNRSSGFASLDTAAQETVKQWRFRPARYGDTRVESWVKVPIVFTLAEAKN